MKKEQFLQAKGFIFADIERELAWFDKGNGSGNFMLALALLCYTEFAGGIKNNSFSRGESRKNFESFFPDLGLEYQELMSKIDVYSIFRCGLAHEYYIKGNCTIAIETNNSIGIWYDSVKDCYCFAVKKYYDDFKKALQHLEQSLTFE